MPIPLPPIHLRPATDTDVAIGARVKELREIAGLSQRDVFVRMVLTGFDSWSPSTVSKVEAGDRSLKLAEALGLASIIGCSPHNLGSTAFVRIKDGEVVGDTGAIDMALDMEHLTREAAFEVKH